MANENARNGIGKVFIGQIFVIISAFCTLLSLIPGMGLMIAGISVLVLNLIGLIISLVGLSKAGKENGRLKTAFTLTMVSIIVEVVCGIMGAFLQVTWMEQIEGIFTTVLSLLITYNVLFGCAELNSELKGRAKGTWKMYMIVVILDIAITIVDLILAIMGVTDVSAIATVILVLIDLVFDFIAYIKYLGFLNIARKEA